MEVNSNQSVVVLHVDDSMDDRLLFQMACQDAGVAFNMHWTASAEEATAWLEAALTDVDGQHPWPDLVLLDIVMPAGTGFELLEHIRSTPGLNSLPVIVFTGDINPDVRDRAYALGANSCVRKPITFSQTVAVARAIYDFWSLDQHPSRPADHAQDSPRAEPAHH